MARKLFAFLLSFAMIFSTFAVSFAANESSFSDMPAEGSWSYEALQSAVANGILLGNAGKLNPKSNITRAEFAAMVVRAFGAFDEADISAFTDVKEGDWFRASIAKAVSMKVMSGTSDTTASPKGLITRQEALVMLARAIKLDAGNVTVLEVFSDAAQISAYAKPYLAAMVSEGFVSGNNGKMNPKKNITREEVAQIFFNIFGKYISQAGTYTDDCSKNVIVNVPGVVLKGCTLDGDLIVGDGVGSGDIVLEDVTLNGRLVVRGGGENSVIIRGSSAVGYVVVTKTSSGNVRVHTEDGAKVDTIVCEDGNDTIILEGDFSNVAIDTDTPVVLRNSDITSVKVNAADAALTLDGDTDVAMLNIASAAENTSVEVKSGAVVTAVDSSAEGVDISGDGKVKTAIVSGDDTNIGTKGTVVTIAEGTENVTVAKEETTSGGGGGYVPPADPQQKCTEHDYIVICKDGAASLQCSVCGEALPYALRTASAEETQSFASLLTGSGCTITNWAVIDTAEDVKEDFRIPSGTALVVAEQPWFYGEVTVERGAALMNSAVGAIVFIEGSSLINNGVILTTAETCLRVIGGGLKNSADAVIKSYIFLDAAASFVNDGSVILSNSQNLEAVYESSIVNNGTILADGGILCNTSSSLKNNGTIVSNEEIHAGNESEIINNGEVESTACIYAFNTSVIENNGIVTCVADDRDYWALNVQDSKLINNGTITTDRSNNFRNAEFVMNPGAVFVNRAHSNVYGGIFDFSKADAASVKNSGIIQALDEYRSEDSLVLDVKLPSGGVDALCTNPENFVFLAYVFDSDGYNNAISIQKNSEKYDWMNICGTMTIENGLPSIFDIYHIMYYSEADGVPVVTLKGNTVIESSDDSHLCELSVFGYSYDGQDFVPELVIDGTLTIGTGGRVHVHSYSKFTAPEGSVFLGDPYDSAFNVWEHEGELSPVCSGLPADVNHTIDVKTLDGLLEAAGSSEFDSIIITADFTGLDGAEKCIDQDLTISSADIQLRNGYSLIVAEGCTLTLDSTWFNNSGAMSVYGNIVLSNGATLYNSSWNGGHGNIEIGDPVPTTSCGAITVNSGCGINNQGSIQIRDSGSIVVNDGGWYSPQVWDADISKNVVSGDIDHWERVYLPEGYKRPID